MLHAIQIRYTNDKGIDVCESRVIADDNYHGIVYELMTNSMPIEICYYSMEGIDHAYKVLYTEEANQYYIDRCDGATDLDFNAFVAKCFLEGEGYYDDNNKFYGTWWDTQFSCQDTCISVFEIDDAQAVLLGFPEFGLQVI